MNRGFALLLFLILILSSLIVVKPARALASIPKPSVPEFTVKLVDSSYDVPTTYSTNPYTGEKVTHPGYRVESRTIEIKIKNQPFRSFLVEGAIANWTVGLYYVIRWKGHYGQDWHEIYYDGGFGFTGFSANLESEYTVIPFKGEYSSTEGFKPEYQGMSSTIPPGAQVDFQVKALIGSYGRDVGTWGWTFTGEESDWSNTQTLTIGTPVSTTSPDGGTTSDGGPQQMDQSAVILGVAITVMVAGAGLGLVYFRRHKRKAER